MKLLPYICNVVCWILLILYFIVSIAFMWDYPSQFSQWLGVFNVIVLSITCFSSEKVEDEYIRSLRLNAIAWTVIILFFIQSISFILSFAGGAFEKSFVGSTVVQLRGDFFFWVIVYLLIFKLRVLIWEWRSKNEK